MIDKDIVLIPHFENGPAIGQAVLNNYLAHAEGMTELLKTMRKEGLEGLNFNTIFTRYVEEHPEAYTRIKPEFFTFTGRRVIVNDKSFFKWYSTTKEGLEYKTRVERIAPELYGHFSKITR